MAEIRPSEISDILKDEIKGFEGRVVVPPVDVAPDAVADGAADEHVAQEVPAPREARKAHGRSQAVDAEAQYYNAQLLLNGEKILSVWPVRPAYALKKSWKFEGRKYTLKPGVYTWFVWPGYGARSAVDYGELMGSRTFRIVR